MTLSDLKTGMIVTTGDGERYLVLRGTGFGGEQEDIICNNGGWIPLSDYDEGMNLSGDYSETTLRDCAIVRVEKATHAAHTLHEGEGFHTIIWEGNRGDWFVDMERKNDIISEDLLKSIILGD